MDMPTLHNNTMHEMPKWNDMMVRREAYEVRMTFKHYKTQFSYTPEDDDYWKAPHEFIMERGGDCEDFAIAWYYDLETRGVWAQVWVGRRHGQIHAIAVTDNWVLDVMEAEPVKRADYKGFEKAYSIDRFGWNK